MPVTARFDDDTAAAYETVEEALDQAIWDAEHGVHELVDVIDGAHDDHRAVDAPTVRAGRQELDAHRADWRRRRGHVAGVLMPRARADEILKAEHEAAARAAER